MIWWIHETILKQKGTEKLKIKVGGRKMNHPNTNYKARVAILLLVQTAKQRALPKTTRNNDDKMFNSSETLNNSKFAKMGSNTRKTNP